jgi:hypothetical protein
MHTFLIRPLSQKIDSRSGAFQKKQEYTQITMVLDILRNFIDGEGVEGTLYFLQEKLVEQL